MNTAVTKKMNFIVLLILGCRIAIITRVKVTYFLHLASKYNFLNGLERIMIHIDTE